MKGHINEHLKTVLANSGRAAGMGILEDRYDEESGYKPGLHGSVKVRFPSDSLPEEDIKKLSGAVKVRYI